MNSKCINFLVTNIIALTIILLLTLFPIYKYWNIFSNPTDMERYEQLYANSQYVLGEASTHKIDDNEVYIYAGYTYIRGDDPTLVNFEHTPLAKYFLGFSYLLTGNSVLLNIPLYFSILLLFYLLASKFIKNKIILYVLIVLIGTQRLFYFNVSQGMLDLPNLFATLLFFNILFSEKKNLILKYLFLGLSLGIFAGTRYPFPSIFLLIIPLLIWAFYKSEFKYLLVTLLSLISTYFATYVIYFKHHSLAQWPKFEWYRFIWFAGNRTIPKFLIFQTIFLGRFLGWWNNEWQTISTWSIVWPITFVGSIVATYKNKFNLKNFVLILYTYGLIIFYSIAAASYDRFLIPIIPYWVILLGIGLDNIGTKSNFLGEIKRSLRSAKSLKDVF
ncbi:MAG: hypothetical protein H6772_00555 [Pseudomonadales bacterium]|nr:hypothetical protein [Pseudomonadales bacterium]